MLRISHVSYVQINFVEFDWYSFGRAGEGHINRLKEFWVTVLRFPNDVRKRAGSAKEELFVINLFTSRIFIG